MKDVSTKGCKHKHPNKPEGHVGNILLSCPRCTAVTTLRTAKYVKLIKNRYLEASELHSMQETTHGHN